MIRNGAMTWSGVDERTVREPIVTITFPELALGGTVNRISEGFTDRTGTVCPPSVTRTPRRSRPKPEPRIETSAPGAASLGEIARIEGADSA